MRTTQCIHNVLQQGLRPADKVSMQVALGVIASAEIVLPPEFYRFHLTPELCAESYVAIYLNAIIADPGTVPAPAQWTVPTVIQALSDFQW